MRSKSFTMILQPLSPLEISLAQGWRFAIDPNDLGEKLEWQTTGHDTSNWENVDTPHTWKAMESYAGYDGIAWYRLSFDCPSQAGVACTRLRFEAVFYIAQVWLNGDYLGSHEGGYTPFEFDVSSHIRPGSDNLLAVRVDNQRSTDRLPAHLFEGRSYGWNNYGGIVRDVKLLLTSGVYVDSMRLVAVPEITGIDQAEQASLSAQVHIHNTGSDNFSGQVTLEVQEEASVRTVSSTLQSFDVSSGKIAVASLETSIHDPKLWHFDHPNLYFCVTSVKDHAGIEYDRKTTIFGVREVSLKDGRFILNGEPVRLAGLSRHADVPGYGLAETPEIMQKDFDDLKTLNMVISRPVHYPQDEYIYDYCDRNGILLSPELPAWQLTAGQMADEHMRALAKQQLSEMVTAACNHPCVWAWSVGNELESDTVAGRAFVHEMVEYVKSLDPTRPVGFASYHLLVGRPWGDATRHTDFVMMNQYFGTWHGPKDSLEPALDTVHLTWPDKIVIVSEFGFSPHWQRIEGPRIIDPDQYYHIPEDVSADSPEADTQRQSVIKEQMATFRSKPYVAAATFWSYRGGMGVVDGPGNPRPSWYTLQEEFAPLKIEKVDFTFSKQSQCRVTVVLQTRGPLDADLPAYTLRSYRLAWEIRSPAGEPLKLRGEVELPILSPGTQYNVNIDIPQEVKKGELHISVIRPTGFTVIERRFDLS